MIRHIVLIRFRPDVSEKQIADIFAGLDPIRAQLPGMLACAAGRSESPEQIERGYMHGLVADFADWEALQAYQVLPDHKRLGAALVAHAEGGIDGILVFDLPIPDAGSAAP